LTVFARWLFCNSFIKDRCAAQFNGVPFYADDDHVSDKGAALIVGKVMNLLPKRVTAQP
jgi:hypothetical protein